MITVEWLDCKLQENRDKLNIFAKDFDHSVENYSHPIYIIKEGDQWLGYCQLVTTPTVFTAWNPKVCSARNIRDAVLHIGGWLKIQHGTGLIAVPLGKTNFVQKILNKLGLKRIGANGTEVYQQL